MTSTANDNRMTNWQAILAVAVEAELASFLCAGRMYGDPSARPHVLCRQGCGSWPRLGAGGVDQPGFVYSARRNMFIQNMARLREGMLT